MSFKFFFFHWTPSWITSCLLWGRRFVIELTFRREWQPPIYYCIGSVIVAPLSLVFDSLLLTCTLSTESSSVRSRRRPHTKKTFRPHELPWWLGHAEVLMSNTSFRWPGREGLNKKGGYPREWCKVRSRIRDSYVVTYFDSRPILQLLVRSFIDI